MFFVSVAPLNHGSKAENVLFFVIQSVSRANTVNMNSPPLVSAVKELKQYGMGKE
jgi:hypothetical protein